MATIELAAVFVTLGHFDRGPSRRAGADAAHHAFELGHAAAGFHGVFILHEDDIVDDIDVQLVGNEAGPDTLNRMPARLEWLAFAALG